MNIFLDEEGAEFIEIDGECYQLIGTASQDATHTLADVDNTYVSCEECACPDPDVCPTNCDGAPDIIRMTLAGFSGAGICSTRCPELNGTYDLVYQGNCEWYLNFSPTDNYFTVSCVGGAWEVELNIDWTFEDDCWIVEILTGTAQACGDGTLPPAGEAIGISDGYWCGGNPTATLEFIYASSS
jgi:hypothetical protein